jgi:hypothetical protein
MKRALALQPLKAVKKDRKAKRERRRLQRKLKLQSQVKYLSEDKDDSSSSSSREVELIDLTSSSDEGGVISPLPNDLWKQVSNDFVKLYRSTFIPLSYIVRFHSVNRELWNVWKTSDEQVIVIGHFHDLLSKTMNFRFMRQTQLLMSYQLSVNLLAVCEGLWNVDIPGETPAMPYSFIKGHFSFGTLHDLLNEFFNLEDVERHYITPRTVDSNFNVCSVTKGIISPLVLKALINVDSYCRSTYAAALVCVDTVFKDEEGDGGNSYKYITQPYVDIFPDIEIALIPYPFSVFEKSMM